MSDQNIYQGPPNWCKFAIPDKQGWVNPATGEILISIGNYFTLRPEYLQYAIPNPTLRMAIAGLSYLYSPMPPISNTTGSNSNTGPVTYSLVQGTLPAGMSLDANVGIVGFPANTATSANGIVIKTTDGANNVLTFGPFDLPVANSLPSDKLRYAPPTLINPIEPGTTANTAQPGTGVDTTLGRGFTARSYDTSQDVYIRGQYQNTASRSGPLQFTGGRHVVVIAGDWYGRKTQFYTQANTVFIEGVRTDCSLNPLDDDALLISGTGYANAGARVFLQNYHAKNLHGTGLKHYLADNTTDNKAAITSMTVDSSSGIDVVLTAALPQGVPTVNQQVQIGGVSYNGNTTPLSNFNYTWKVSAVTDSTHFKIVASKGNAVPPAAAQGTGGFLWGMHNGNTTIFGTSTTGEHADGVQLNDTNALRGICVDKVTVDTNYQGSIFNGPGQNHSSYSRMNIRFNVNSYLLQDYGSLAMHNENPGATSVEYNDVYVEARLNQPFDPSVTIAPLAGSVDALGRAIGAVATTYNGRSAITWPLLAKSYGYVLSGAPANGDFAPWGTPGLGVPGFGYISPGYLDAKTPVDGDILDILLSATTVSGSAAANTVIGRVNATHKTKGQIIDITLKDTSSGKLAMVGNALSTTATPLGAAGTFPIVLVATIRGTSITKEKPFTLTIT
jgi:hypothetical protein